MVLVAPSPCSRVDRSAAAESPSAHLVGVCGSGMRALAEVLRGSGWNVSGSDLHASERTIAAFSRRGLRIHAGHQTDFVPANADVLVYSPAVGPENAERQRAARRGIPQFSYSQMLGRLMEGRVGVCVAGTHGKSTTTAMTGFILTGAGLDPSVVVGAEFCELGVSGWAGQGQHFVVESCEYQQNFLNLTPTHAAILSVEPDHFDCYAHFDETVAAFSAFAQKVPADGTLLIPETSEPARAACVAAGAPVETFGLIPEAAWWATDVRPTAEGVRFRIFHRGEFFIEARLRLSGSHNVENALAAVALSHRAGAGRAAIREGLAEFPGLRRRFELVGTWRGVTLVDDYAHHPTAVAATLAAARERFRERRLWCVFQPHQVSRTRALFDEFAHSLLAADETLLVPVFAARECCPDEPEIASCELAARVAAWGKRARFAANLDHALATLDHELQAGDVLLTLGAGDIGRIHYEFARRLQRHPAT
ncbi:MAG: UDP-N-acetylmuramate--L-alanine ligase [Planctomycetaceae bacterium]